MWHATQPETRPLHHPPCSLLRTAEREKIIIARIQQILQLEFLRRSAQRGLSSQPKRSLTCSIEEHKPALGIKRKHRRLHRAHHALYKGHRLEGPRSLSLQHPCERIHLQRKIPQRIVPAPAPRAERVVVLAQRSHHILQRLQGSSDLLRQQGYREGPRCCQRQ